MSRRARRLAAAAVWALAASSPAGAGLVELGPEVQVVSEPAGTSLRPAVATAPDGRSVVVWAVRSSESGIAILFRRLEEDGSAGGAPAELAVLSGPLLSGGGPLAAAGSDGSFLVVWNDGSLFARRVAPGGEPGPVVEVVAVDGPAEVPGDLALAADPRGGYVLAGTTDPPDSTIVLQRLDSGGAPAGPRQVVAVKTDAGSVGPPELSVSASGVVVVVWPAGVSRDNQLHYEVHGRWLAPSGAALGPVRSLGERGADRGLAVTHTSGGDAIVAWEGRPFHVELRRYDGTGTELGDSRVDLDSETTVYQQEERLHLAPTTAGGALLAWVAEGLREPFVLGQLLGADAAPVGDLFRISDFNFGGASNAEISSDGASGGLAAWVAGGHAIIGLYVRPLRLLTAGAVAVAEPAYRAPEGGGPVVVTVRRTGFAEGAISVDYETAGGSAEAGRDYRHVAGSLSWADGDLSERTVEVPILQDADLEGPEVVDLVLSEPTGGAVLAAPATARLVIEDDDGLPPSGATPAPLSVEEVACDRARLAGLLERLELVVPHSGKGAGIDLSLTASGDFAGIAYTGNGPGTAEHHLAFSTDPEVTTLLLNPERLQLPAVALARNRVNSDLVAPGDGDTLEVRLRPTLGDAPADPAELLVIDNVDAAAGRASQVKPGRGLAGLLAPCHRGVLVPRDEHVLRVLSKIVRLEAQGAARTEIALYRGEEVDSYRIDAYALDGQGRSLGRAAAELDVRYGADGSLAGGELRLLPPCQGGACTTLERPGRLLLVRPTFTGELWDPTPYAVETPAAPGGETVPVDWRALLAGTTWLRAL